MNAAIGGADSISVTGGTNVILAGSGNDSVVGNRSAGVQSSGFVVLGDSGRVELDGLGRATKVETTFPATGGEDSIRIDNGDDVVFGGDSSDSIQVGSGANIVIGDHGTAILSESGQVLTLSTSYLANGGNDVIVSSSGDDFIIGGPGSDTIQGGADFDTAAYDGAFSEYTVVVDGTKATVTRNSDGSTDELESIAELQFMGATGQVVYSLNTLRIGEDDQILLIDDGKLTVGIVTSGGQSTFDRNSSLARDQFNLTFTPDYRLGAGNYRLSDSNPGQFYYNLMYDGTPRSTADLSVNIPYPFRFQGAVPMHVYNDVMIDEVNGELAFTPVEEIANYKQAGGISVVLMDTNLNGIDDFGDFYEVKIKDVPTSDDGFVYLSFHLDYGLEKQTGWLLSSNLSGTDNAVTNPDLLVQMPPLLDNSEYRFTASDPSSTLGFGLLNYSLSAVRNDNQFKNLRGVGGFFQSDSGSTDFMDHEPVANQKIVVIDESTKDVMGIATTDADGWFFAGFIATGTATAYRAIWDQNGNGIEDDLTIEGHSKFFLMGGNAGKWGFVNYGVMNPTMTENGTITHYDYMLPDPLDSESPSLISMNPANQSTDAAMWQDLKLVFNEKIAAGTGEIEIYNSDGTIWARIDVTDSSKVAVVDSTLSINPTENLLPGKSYYVQVPASAITDLSGNAFVGIQGKRAWNFAIATPGVRVVATNGTTTTEGGGTASFTLRLDSKPSANVVIPVGSSVANEGSISHLQLVFTPSNWNMLQTVTVTGVNDFLDDGDKAYALVIGAAISEDIAYNGLDPADIAIKNVDDDTAGVTVSAPNRSTTTEDGGTVWFSIQLDAQPSSNVNFSVSSNDTTEGVASINTLTFTPSNWNLPQTVTVTGVNDAIYDGDQTFTVILGAVVSTDTKFRGIDPADVVLVNIDNEPKPTKFYVVDDSTTDRTYEYDASGQNIEDYSISNSGSRGIVSTASGDKLWVVDASRLVYIYNNSGVLLGSWNAGTMTSTAVVQGIATDGTHIWIVDSFSDRIYYYANAASRLSGSLTATSSYALLGGNTNPTDIVYGKEGKNGVLWVVDDGGTDKVFRYALGSKNASIALVTSWSLNVNNTKPTGITLDPGSTSGGHIWVLDNGTTKQVFKYSNGRNVTNSSTPNSSVDFVLTGLANPQGIADPPVSGAIDAAYSQMSDEFGSMENVDEATIGNLVDLHRMERFQDKNQSMGQTIAGMSANGILFDSKATKQQHPSLESLTTGDHESVLMTPIRRDSLHKKSGKLKHASTDEFDAFFEDFGNFE
jgi:hypothetical protein